MVYGYKCQVYGYARNFAKIGVAGALVDSLHAGLSSPGLVSASIALKAITVNVSLSKSDKMPMIFQSNSQWYFNPHADARVVSAYICYFVMVFLWL
jgi:hypothetical protein